MYLSLCPVAVIILSVRGTLTRNFLLEAYYLNMTKGEWAFLDVELYEVSCDAIYSNSCLAF